MTNNKNLANGVEYYNIKITKLKQNYNKYTTTSFPLLISSEAIASDSGASSSCEDGHSEEAKPQVIHHAIAYPTPHDLITHEQVERAFVQLYKNDEGYKLKTRLNLIIDNKRESADFIAALTQDRRNFKKYLPEHGQDWFIEWSDTWIKEIKNMLGVKAYRGKFHCSQTWIPGRRCLTQIEPWSQCVVWFNPEIKQWCYAINIYEFQITGTMMDYNITPRQRQTNLHRQDVWVNADYDQRQRPKTWAEQRGQK